MLTKKLLPRGHITKTESFIIPFTRSKEKQPIHSAFGRYMKEWQTLHP